MIMILDEKKIEQAFITNLQNLKYTYRQDIIDKNTLEQNFRKKFEALNQVKLTDSEFARLRNEIVNADVFAAAKTLRETNLFNREDGTPLRYTLVNIESWCKNTFEVINQLRINTNNSYHRYDVILLINGLPLVQVELKALSTSPRRAIQQIVDYKNDVGNGYSNTLLCFMQLFIVSNRDNTYYFANNNNAHFSFDAKEKFLPIYQFADKDNKKITYLDDFTNDFLAKCALGQTISRYMVLVESEQKILMMRPYQIYAVQAIVECITQDRGNGYIWHTTGSGKTLTSFKAATLLKNKPDIHKCLFVVDRKDLDRQTRAEFNKFQENCVEENTNTKALVERLISESHADKVIVTTIQKLGLALGENNPYNKKQNSTYKKRLEPLRDKRMVFIFDECHRSQFGQNHQTIKEFFPNAQLFGFTGTPIFAENASYSQIDGTEKTHTITEDIFQKQLHAYTITHAIEDRNVLRFHVDYFAQDRQDNHPQQMGPVPEDVVVKEIIKKHNSATNERLFNAILATDSINKAIKYYQLFKDIQAEYQQENKDYRALNIACVFSPPAQGNPDAKQMQEDLPQEKVDNQQEPEQKKAALTKIMSDYNNQYKTNHHINEFDLYYQDLQLRIKDHKYLNSDYPAHNKIDITIVVDMLLTGFDSQYLNTLYVDKNLKHHGLIQAFSRTNRVLNDTKPYGNILDFRHQETAVNNAIALFSGQDKERAKEIWLVESAPVIINKLDNSIISLKTFMGSQGLEYTPDAVNNLAGDDARAEFINQFKTIQRLKTQLNQYTDLSDADKNSIEQLMPEDDLRGFRGMYLETARQLKEQQDKGGAEVSEVVTQLDLELVLFSSVIIDYDYIMGLIAQYTQNTPEKQTMTREQLVGLLSSSAELMDEYDNIRAYIDTLETNTSLNKEGVKNGYKAFRKAQFNKTLKAIANTHGLEVKDLQAFVDNVTERMVFDGEQLTDLFSPLGFGWRERSQKEVAFMQDLIPYLKKLVNNRDISGLAVYE